MTRLRLTAGCTLVIEQGDITRVAVDAIVNAANPRMLGGGGVDGAIHRAAGPELLTACRAVPEVTPELRCPRGEARITPGFGLPAAWVIHTVGPVYESTETSAPVLRAAYRATLELAGERGLRSVAFPAISCGVYGYPVDEAATLSIETCAEHAGKLREIRFVLFDETAHRSWSIAAETAGLVPE